MSNLFKKAGGGFLNNVAGIITGYKFDNGLKGEGDNGPWTKLSVEMHVQQDGASESVTTFLDAGFSGDPAVTVSPDGLSLVSESDEPLIRENTEFAGFIGSMIENGFPEANFEAGQGRNFAAMIGRRVTFVKVVDEERNKRQGKRKDKKTGKEYNHELLRVSAVHAVPAVTTAAAPAKKTSGKKATNGSGKVAAPDTTAADTALKAILGKAADQTVEKGKIGSLVIRYALENKLSTEDREALRKQLTDDTYLQGADERGLVVFQADVKNQPIVLA